MGSPIELGQLQSGSVPPPITPEEQEILDRIRSGQVRLEATPSAQQQHAEEVQQRWPQADPGIQVAPTLPVKPTNPYAPTGWRKKESKEFDLVVPSGQKCRLRRLERSDLFRHGLMDHADELLPLLIDIDDMTLEQKNERIKDAMKNNVHLIGGIFSLVDVAVMSCCIKPMVTNDPQAVSYGTEADHQDPNFIPIVHISDIDEDDRQYIFDAVFRSEADALKSVQQQTTSMESVSTSESIQQAAE